MELWNIRYMVNQTLQDVLKENGTVFKEEFGTLQRAIAKICVDPTTCLLLSDPEYYFKLLETN